MMDTPPALRSAADAATSDRPEPNRPLSTPPLPRGQRPDLTTEQMREVDRIMVDELHITLAQMMENAGRNLVELAVSRYEPASCTVLAGPGGNGGGGLVAARHLAPATGQSRSSGRWRSHPAEAHGTAPGSHHLPDREPHRSDAMELHARTLTAGVVGGLAGGVAFGILMTVMGMMEMVAGLANSGSVAVGWVVHMVISAAFGAGLALVAGPLASTAGRAAGLGVLYGIVVWVVGALLAMPLLMGMTPFTIGEPQIMSLMGHAIYGVITGVVYQRLASTRQQAGSRA